MAGNCLDEPRPSCLVSEGFTQGPHTLGQRLVSDRNALPYLIQKARLGHQPALLGHQQDKRVEIATGQLYRPAVSEQAAIRSIQNEAVETINASHVFQDFLTGRSGLSPPTPSPFKPHPSWKRRQ